MGRIECVLRDGRVDEGNHFVVTFGVDEVRADQMSDLDVGAVELNALLYGSDAWEAAAFRWAHEPLEDITHVRAWRWSWKCSSEET